MFQTDISLFLLINAAADSPQWLLSLARFASLELPQLLLAGAVGACVVGDTHVRRTVGRMLLAMAAAWLVARLGQTLYPIARPFTVGLGTQWLGHRGSAGFPSTHASVAFAFAGVAAAASRRTVLAAMALGAAGLIAWSRVCLGLHFPLDVLAGAVLGLSCAWGIGKLARLLPAMPAA